MQVSKSCCLFLECVSPHIFGAEAATIYESMTDMKLSIETMKHIFVIILYI